MQATRGLFGAHCCGHPTGMDANAANRRGATLEVPSPPFPDNPTTPGEPSPIPEPSPAPVPQPDPGGPETPDAPDRPEPVIPPGG